MREYEVMIYNRRGREKMRKSVHFSAENAFKAVCKALGRRSFTSVTRLAQRHPEEAARDNCHAQLDRLGLAGAQAVRREIASRRHNLMDEQAAHIADGTALAPARSDALSACGFLDRA